MIIHVHNTSEITVLDGVECRIWEGTTDGGVEVVAFIPRLVTRRDQDASELEAELVEKPAPRATEWWPARMLS